ncbi:MAG: uracil-DNA glycosylase [Anaerolineae bacterium]|nr:uracil-DNA glycosylase [Anaerolineae bacterium]
MVNMDRTKAIESLNAEIKSCTLCPLHAGRTHAVPGAGPLDADIMFIGEAPGFHEDQQGIPFVGAAGKFLNELLDSAGIDRNKVFITNVIKCRPPGNRDPDTQEVGACKDYLDRQIALIKPKVIVTLGRHSMARAFPDEKVSRVHGIPRKVGSQVYFPMYHPAAALHQPSLRPTVEEDFRRLRQLLEGELLPDEYTPPPTVEQLSLF